LKLLDQFDPRLREVSAKVEGPIKDLAEEVLAVLKENPQGIALAAPQVGVPLRFFVLRKAYAAKKQLSWAIVNPTWVPLSLAAKRPEGCLSLPGLQKIKFRHTAIKVTFEDLNGKVYTRTITDPLLAQIFQHEIEHLDGVLLTDT